MDLTCRLGWRFSLAFLRRADHGEDHRHQDHEAGADKDPGQDLAEPVVGVRGSRLTRAGDPLRAALPCRASIGGQRLSAELSPDRLQLLAQLGHRRLTPGRILGQHTLQQGVEPDHIQAGGQRQLAQRRNRLGGMSRDHRAGIGAGERRFAGEQVIQQAAQAVDIAARITGAIGGFLRREIPGQGSRAIGGQFAFFKDAHHSDIGELDPAISHEDDVRGPQITVDHASGMGHAQGTGDLVDDQQGEVGIDGAIPLHELLKGVALDPFHAAPEQAVAFAALVELHQTVIANAADLAGLGEEALGQLGIAHAALGFEDLERHRTFEIQLLCIKDRPEHTPAEVAIEAITADSGANQGRHIHRRHFRILDRRQRGGALAGVIEGDDDLADAELVTVAQPFATGDLLAIERSAVGGLEILDPPEPLSDEDLRMLAAGGVILDLQPAGAMSAEDAFLGEGKFDT